MEKDARRRVRERESESRGDNRAGAVSNLGPNFNSKMRAFGFLCHRATLYSVSFSHSSSSTIMDLPKGLDLAVCKNPTAAHKHRLSQSLSCVYDDDSDRI